MTYQLNQTSTQRLGSTPAAGQAVLDTTLNQWFVGDGSTVGGISVVSPNANANFLLAIATLGAR